MNPALKRRGIVVAVATLLVAVAAIFGGSFTSNKESAARTAQAVHPSTPEVPEDVSAILSLKAARSITGVSKLAWSGSDGVMDRVGTYHESGTRYSTSIYAHPDRTDKYVDVRVYKGHSTFMTLSDVMLDLSTEDNAWEMINPRLLARSSDVPQAFMAVRYARNGSKISTLCFIFKQFTVRIETDNLSDKVLINLGKESVSGMYALNPASV